MRTIRAGLSRVGMIWRGWSRWRRAGVVSVLAVLLALLPVGAAAASLRLQYAGDPSVDARTRGRDAVWLGHVWVDGRKTDADVAALATQLTGTGIRDVYVHTGPLEHDGSLPAAVYPRAGWFLDAVHRLMPQLRVQAWLGDVVAPEKDGLHLDEPAVRDRIASSSTQVLALGFDGVHLDLEPVRSGSAGFLALLDQVHALTTEQDKVLSIAAPSLSLWPGTGSGGRRPTSQRPPGGSTRLP
jgi:hypothetical protein